MQLPTTYEFIEKTTGKIMGRMTVRAEIAGSAGWTTTEKLEDILDGGLEGGFVFAFPCQEAPHMSHGHGTLYALPDMASGGSTPYGSTDGSKVDIGCVIGNVSGFYNDNKVMTLTFDPDGVGGQSHGSSVTTMLNNAEEDCFGVAQDGQGDEHGDKYIYLGEWVRKEV